MVLEQGRIENVLIIGICILLSTGEKRTQVVNVVTVVELCVHSVGRVHYDKDKSDLDKSRGD